MLLTCPPRKTILCLSNMFCGSKSTRPGGLSCCSTSRAYGSCSSAVGHTILLPEYASPLAWILLLLEQPFEEKISDWQRKSECRIALLEGFRRGFDKDEGKSERQRAGDDVAERASQE
jgi:hypothetical protein